MAGELKKPDLVHTLWPEEIEKKDVAAACARTFYVRQSNFSEAAKNQH